MRQAGRSLPEYRELRHGRTLMELAMTPELAAEVTLPPVRRHGVDAAVLFSDTAASGRSTRRFSPTPSALLANTVSAFALGDYEWLLAFEADDQPFLTGRRRPLADAVADLP
jgi:hypothetical protein